MRVKLMSSGFTLFEVLIAWFIITSTLLAFVSQQVIRVGYLKKAYDYSVAVSQLQSMLERLRVDRSVNARLRACASWNLENQAVLPGGHGDCLCGEGVCQINLQWRKGKNLSVTGWV